MQVVQQPIHLGQTLFLQQRVAVCQLILDKQLVDIMGLRPHLKLLVGL